MTIDHVEIMRRVAEIAPQMAERAVACDEARQVVSEKYARHDRRGDVPYSTAGAGRRL